MKISGHKIPSVFNRYNFTSEKDLKQAATRLGEYINKKKVTLSVTLDELYQIKQEGGGTEVLEKSGKELELARGIEPPTGGLQNHCSAD